MPSPSTVAFTTMSPSTCRLFEQDIRWRSEHIIPALWPPQAVDVALAHKTLVLIIDSQPASQPVLLPSTNMTSLNSGFHSAGMRESSCQSRGNGNGAWKLSDVSARHWLRGKLKNLEKPGEHWCLQTIPHTSAHWEEQTHNLPITDAIMETRIRHGV